MNRPIQVTSGANNFPTTRFEFAGMAYGVVDHGTWLDASMLSFTRIGAAGVRFGAPVDVEGYGFDYGNDYGGT
jgi:hypothetical protein